MIDTLSNRHTARHVVQPAALVVRSHDWLGVSGGAGYLAIKQYPFKAPNALGLVRDLISRPPDFQAIQPSILKLPSTLDLVREITQYQHGCSNRGRRRKSPPQLELTHRVGQSPSSSSSRSR